jgi:hypothetical protein
MATAAFARPAAVLGEEEVLRLLRDTGRSYSFSELAQALRQRGVSEDATVESIWALAASNLVELTDDLQVRAAG